VAAPFQVVCMFEEDERTAGFAEAPMAAEAASILPVRVASSLFVVQRSPAPNALQATVKEEEEEED